MLLNESDAKQILIKVKEYSKADSFITILTGLNIANLRFALNSISTNGFSDGLTLTITSDIGKRSGSVSINNISNQEIKKAVEKTEEIARLSPENKEYVEVLEEQSYSKSINFKSSIESLNFDKRASLISDIISKSIKNDTISAGYWQDELNFTAIYNSKGLFAYNKGTLASYSATVRTRDGNGSSRVQNQYVDINEFNMERLSNNVIKKSMISKKPIELKPGKYTVILEPSATADFIANLTRFMDARSADEGRSYFSKNGKGNKIGERLVDERVNIYSNPIDTRCPSINFTYEGYPIINTSWFENGILKNLMRNRYWAEKTNQPVIPYYSNLLMEGTNKTIEDLISETDYGILVTRFWYIRTVDPQSILLTGLTRDGLFEIKDGKIANSIKNFRFNESPINILNNLLEIGKSENGVGSETDNTQIFAPSLKIKNFNFSTLSDAI